MDDLLDKLRGIVTAAAPPRAKAEAAARLVAGAMGTDVEAAAAAASDPIDLLFTTIIDRYGAVLPAAAPRPAFDVKLADLPRR